MLLLRDKEIDTEHHNTEKDDDQRNDLYSNIILFGGNTMFKGYAERFAEEIKKLAKENNCTITGSGYQDIYWGELINAIAAYSYKITKIKAHITGIK